MDIRILGCYGGVPSKEGACSSFLVSSGDTKVLVDCGSGITSQIQKYIEMKDLDAIMISHLHFDHFNDLFTMYYLYKVGINMGELKKLAVFIPTEPVEVVMFLKTQMGDVFDFYEYSHEDKLAFGDFTFEYHKTQHGLVTYAMRITDKTETVGYTADTGYNEDLVKFLTGCSTIIAESSLLETLPKNPSHMTALEAYKFGINAKVERVVLTHFWYAIDLGEYIEETYIIRNEKKDIATEIYFAAEGMRIKGGVVSR